MTSLRPPRIGIGSRIRRRWLLWGGVLFLLLVLAACGWHAWQVRQLERLVADPEVAALFALEGRQPPPSNDHAVRVVRESCQDLFQRFMMRTVATNYQPFCAMYQMPWRLRPVPTTYLLDGVVRSFLHTATIAILNVLRNHPTSVVLPSDYIDVYLMLGGIAAADTSLGDPQGSMLLEQVLRLHEHMPWMGRTSVISCQESAMLAAHFDHTLPTSTWQAWVQSPSPAQQEFVDVLTARTKGSWEGVILRRITGRPDPAAADWSRSIFAKIGDWWWGARRARRHLEHLRALRQSAWDVGIAFLAKPSAQGVVPNEAPVVHWLHSVLGISDDRTMSIGSANLSELLASDHWYAASAAMAVDARWRAVRGVGLLVDAYRTRRSVAATEQEARAIVGASHWQGSWPPSTLRYLMLSNDRFILGNAGMVRHWIPQGPVLVDDERQFFCVDCAHLLP